MREWGALNVLTIRSRLIELFSKELYLNLTILQNNEGSLFFLEFLSP